MGVLDDAIREHLELKRQHGASDDEIERAEAEALGPARREPALDPYALEGEGPADGSEAPLSDAEAAGPATELLLPEDVPPPPEDAVPATELPPPPFEPEPEPEFQSQGVYDDAEEPEAAAPLGHQDAPVPDPSVLLGDDPLAPPPADPRSPPEPLPPPRAPDDEFEPDEVPADEALSDDTLIHDLRPREAPLPPEDPDADGPPAPAVPRYEDPSDSGDDALEQGPDFREDEGEHDKLWFEQKPRRDFDFDE